MDIGELITAIIFILFAVSAVVKRIAEGREAEKRRDEPVWTAEDLPEETRRMLFGDTEPPKARPAPRPTQLDPFDEPMRAPVQRRTVEPRTAKPRQGTPRPPTPPVRREAPRPVHRQEPASVPVEQRKPPAVPRNVPEMQQQQQRAQQLQREQERLAREEHMRRQQRQQQASQAQTRKQQASPRPPKQRRQSPQAQQQVQVRPPMKAVQAPKVRSRWLATKEDVRRAIILSEILGPPKALQ